MKFRRIKLKASLRILSRIRKEKLFKRMVSREEKQKSLWLIMKGRFKETWLLRRMGKLLKKYTVLSPVQLPLPRTLMINKLSFR